VAESSTPVISGDRNPYLYQCPVFGDWHDPLAVRRALFLGSDQQFNAWLEENRSNDTATVMLAHEKMLPVIRAAFKLPPIDREKGTGVADQQALDVLTEYLDWMERVGKA
jgi:hypothetical protein